MKIRNNDKRYNEQECWDKYMSWGAAASVPRLLAWHKSENGFGSRMGAVFAMWRWAIKNPEICYPQYQEWLNKNTPNAGEGEEFLKQYPNYKKKWIVENFGRDGVYKEITFNEFLDVLKNRVIGYEGSVLGKKAYKRFCDKYQLKE